MVVAVGGLEGEHGSLGPTASQPMARSRCGGQATSQHQSERMSFFEATHLLHISSSAENGCNT